MRKPTEQESKSGKKQLLQPIKAREETKPKEKHSLNKNKPRDQH